MGASPSPHGFAVVRGRGYRPDQVDRRIADLTEDRDEALEHAGRLTVLARELTEEATRLRSTVASLAPQTYESLGERAQLLLSVCETEAAALREAAEVEAAQLRDSADLEARRLTERGRRRAAETRAAAEATAVTTVSAAQAYADETRTTARDEVDALRGEAVTILRETTRHCQSLIANLQEKQAMESEAFDRELAEREVAVAGLEAELAERGETLLAEAKACYAEAEESVRSTLREAEARAAEILAEAQRRTAHLAQETERVVGEHATRAAEMRREMAQVRGRLSALGSEPPATEGESGADESDHPVPGQATGPEY